MYSKNYIDVDGKVESIKKKVLSLEKG